MPQRNYLISTTALSLTPSGTTIGSGNTTSATFALARTMVRTGIGAGELSSGSRTWSIHYVVSAMTTPYEMQFKLQRLNSSGVMQSESGFGAARSATGTFDDNITWDSGTWAANDQLALVWEHRRPSGTGSKNGTVDANGSSYIDAPLPIVVTTVTPSTVSTTITGFAPSLKLVITPALNDLTTTHFAPSLRTIITPGVASLTTTQFASVLDLRITPVTQSLNITAFTVSLNESVIPSISTLTTSTFAPTLTETITPPSLAVQTASFAPVLLENVNVTVPTVGLTIISPAPHILPANIIYLDPGGDAVQVTGYFNTVVANGAQISFDNTQQVAGVGSWKFDSGVGNLAPIASVNGVLGAERRGSFYFRYSDVPDTTVTATEFTETAATYSGAGFVDEIEIPNNQRLSADDGFYGLATPPKNEGQGAVYGSFGFADAFSGTIPVGAIIDSVKIIYERKYDIDTSIGISRVKWRVNGEEGPDHDNTDMPLTDTVVEVDVTGERGWTREDLFDAVTVGEENIPVFEVIAEARRGDTDTAHTQSWDFLKVQIGYHEPVAICSARDVSNNEMFQLALFQRGAGVSLRFTSTLSGQPANSFDGISELAPNEWHRISLPFVEHGADNLDFKLFVNSIPELDLVEVATGGFTGAANVRYGWLNPPGANRSIWFDQLYIDGGSDMEDPGDIRSTAKLPATVNNDNFDTTGGTGAVDERPVNLDNYRQQAATAQVAQDYTIQAADEGDVDISTETLIGHMYWLIAKKSFGGGLFFMVVNGTTVELNPTLTTSPSLRKVVVMGSNYPSSAASIGMISSTSSNDTFLYECGIVPAYQGPDINPNRLLERQQLNNETLDTIVDDLRADPPDSYEVCCDFDDFDGTVEIVIHSLDQDGGSLSYQGTLYSKGRTRITPGVEVQLDVTVTGVTNLQIWRRINFD